MQRRDLLKGGAIAALVTVTLGNKGCSAKDLSVYVQTVVGVLRELQPLLPNAAQLIVKAIKIAEDFDVFYRAGKFADAKALFANLAELLSQIAADVGVTSPTVKVALLVAGIAMRAIAVLLASQANQPAIMAALSIESPEAKRQTALIEKLADTIVIDRLFAAVHP